MPRPRHAQPAQRRSIALLLLPALALPLAACGALPFGRPAAPVLVDRREAVDTSLAGAEAMVNAFRARNGLGPVRISPVLTGIAVTQANAMARQDRMSHDVAGAFQDRLRAGGYSAGVAAENISAGQRSFAGAMQSWETSPGHRANLLKPTVSELGVAVALAPNSRYQVFWAMVLGEPLSAPRGAVFGGYGR